MAEMDVGEVARMKKLKLFDDAAPVFVKKERKAIRRRKTEGSGGSGGRRTTRRTVMEMFFGGDTSSVSFGEVSVREFRRTLSKEAVPSDGGWPLGLSDEVVSDYTLPGTVEDFEHRRQQELQQRYVKLVQKQRFDSNKSNNPSKTDDGLHFVRCTPARPRLSREHTHKKARRSSAEDINIDAQDAQDAQEPELTLNSVGAEAEPEPPQTNDVKLPPGDLETRQFDYCRKRGSKKAGRFSPGALRKSKGAPTYDVLHSENGNNPLFCVKSEEERQQILQQNIPEHLRQQKQSDNDSDTPLLESSFNVTTIRKDLDELRRLQQQEDALGCTCAKLNLFIPTTKDEENDHRRLTQSQLMDELQKRGLLYDSVKKLPRHEMERILFKHLKTEPCCWGDHCPCVKNGIECQFDSCSCWKTSTMRGMTPQKAKDKCGNPFGLHIIVMSKIKKHRRTTLRDVEEKRQEQQASLNLLRYIPMLLPKMDTVLIAIGVIYFLYILLINRTNNRGETSEL